MGPNLPDTDGAVSRGTSLSPSFDGVMAEIQDLVRAVERAWSEAEGRRGTLAQVREEIENAKAALESEKDHFQQEQFRFRKESTTVRHALDENLRLVRENEALRSSRGELQQFLQRLLEKVVALRKSLQP